MRTSLCVVPLFWSLIDSAFSSQVHACRMNMVFFPSHRISLWIDQIGTPGLPRSVLFWQSPCMVKWFLTSFCSWYFRIQQTFSCGTVKRRRHVWTSNCRFLLGKKYKVYYNLSNKENSNLFMFFHAHISVFDLVYEKKKLARVLCVCHGALGILFWHLRPEKLKPPMNRVS